jgi:hypothetical protein
MDQLEEVFLEKWDPCVLINKLTHMKNNKNETVREFHDNFERLFQQILVIHHPSHDSLIFLYTKSFAGKISFLIKDEAPRTIQEVYNMATEKQSQHLLIQRTILYSRSQGL